MRKDIINIKSYGTVNYPQPKLELPKISLDTEYLLNPDNLDAIRSNIKVKFGSREGSEAAGFFVFSHIRIMG